MRKLSVIVPVYNDAQTVDRCVESVLSHAPPDLELILVDDGSTDESGRACDAWADADPRVRALHQKNRGVSAARNRGLAEASGEFVGFADADDAVTPRYLSGALSLIERFDADIVMGGVREIYTARAMERAAGGSEPILLEGSAKDGYVRFLVSNAPGEEPGLPPGASPDEIHAKLYRKSVLTACGAAFPEGVFFGEDALFNLHAFRAARRVIVAPEIWYDTYRRAGSLSYRLNPALYENSHLFFSVLDAFVASTPDAAERDALARLSCFRRVNWLLMMVKRYAFCGRALKRTEKLRFVRAILSDEGYRRALAAVDGARLPALKRLFVYAAWRGWTGVVVALAALSQGKAWLRGYRPRGRRMRGGA